MLYDRLLLHSHITAFSFDLNLSFSVGLKILNFVSVLANSWEMYISKRKYLRSLQHHIRSDVFQVMVTS
ncbi:hypothetical protein CMV_016804 [Castanea mollissima]|uniref:Uncharacterized protein n=1 Tax=Castanea mollissima TaxID=60419 RepID=A0A8J4VEC0_9ROSI|nr:hypothetical protein CMV_016804 [Castanea mollissima]